MGREIAIVEVCGSQVKRRVIVGGGGRVDSDETEECFGSGSMFEARSKQKQLIRVENRI